MFPSAKRLLTERQLIRQHMLMLKVEVDGHLSHSHGYLVTSKSLKDLQLNQRMKNTMKWHLQDIKHPYHDAFPSERGKY